MEIALIAAVVIGILDYLLLMPGRKDDRDDEEQIQYLKEWREKHKEKQTCRPEMNTARSWEL